MFLSDKLRVVSGSQRKRNGKYEHITPILIDLHWLPYNQFTLVEYRITYKILLLVYKAINGLSPSYISNLLSFCTGSYSLRSCSNYFKSRDLSLSGPHLVSGQPSSIHVHRTRIAIRVPFQTNLGSTSSKCGQFYSSSIQLYRARLKRRARRTQSALIDLSYFYRARFATYSIEHGLPRIL